MCFYTMNKYIYVLSQFDSRFGSVRFSHSITATQSFSGLRWVLVRFWSYCLTCATWSKSTLLGAALDVLVPRLRLRPAEAQDEDTLTFDSQANTNPKRS